MDINDISEEQAKKIFKLFESKIGKKLKLDVNIHDNSLLNLSVDGRFFVTIDEKHKIDAVFDSHTLKLNRTHKYPYRHILQRFIDELTFGKTIAVRNPHNFPAFVLLMKFNQPIEELLSSSSRFDSLNKMNISEEQARKILEYLAKKSGASKIEYRMFSDRTIGFYLIDSNGQHFIRYVEKSIPYVHLQIIDIPQAIIQSNIMSRFLSEILKLATDHDIVSLINSEDVHHPTVFLKSGTTYEQLMIEMDLAT